MESLKSTLPETPDSLQDDDTFKAPLGLKLFLVFFILLGAFILADTLVRFFQ